MNKKRSIVISAVAVLVIIIGVAVFLANNRTTVNAQPIPVTGLSNAGGSQPNQIAQQNQAANNKDRKSVV